MAFLDELRQILEKEETETVGTVFGGTTTALRSKYSLPKVRDWIAAAPFDGTSPIEKALQRTRSKFSKRVFKIVIGGLVRFSFLIELTNLKLGSTKMKTRWMPARIQTVQPGSFENIEGIFQPGNDPRSATYDECASIFTKACQMVCDNVVQDPSLGALIQNLHKVHRVPYEFPLSYLDPHRDPVHAAENLSWVVNGDLHWLLEARKILSNASGEVKDEIHKIEKSKFEVKVFKTDRALTGKDKTNRAKRWEVLAGDFQHAPLEKCWAAERKLITDLVNFQDFPPVVKIAFSECELIPANATSTLCPVTFEPLSYGNLVDALLNPSHGKSQYQIGHLNPLKRGGVHDGANICWQSADGNRIQGDLTIEETYNLLDQITERRKAQTAASQS